jgi:pimeloyl-ACP methyl ester carboxylesterase
MAHPTVLRNGLFLGAALSLFSCVSGPALRSARLERARIVAPVPSADPGSLLEAEALRIIPASENWLTLELASPWLVGTQIKMGVLEKEGYAAWRESRLNSLSDIQPVRIAFIARLPEGGSERQSGMIYLPAARPGQAQKLTWLIFEKGTELLRDNTPSRGKGQELPFVTEAAALGYAVWVPDYSGMGDGQGMHEYCVAESLADSALDGLAAARAWLGQATVAGQAAYGESGRLAIIGYSEGGLAAMGTLKSIADKRIATPGLSLAAVYPMGAPLDLGIAVPALGPKPYLLDHPEYQIFLALGWARAYPEKVKLRDFLLPRTIEKIVPLFDGTKDDDYVNRQIVKLLGKKVTEITDADIFTPEYLAALRSDPGSTAYYRVQEEQSLDHWTPPSGVPIILAATPTDETVPFGNSLGEYDWAKANAPTTDVTLVRLASASHMSAGVEAFLYSMVDFDRREAKARVE